MEKNFSEASEVSETLAIDKAGKVGSVQCNLILDRGKLKGKRETRVKTRNSVKKNRQKNPKGRKQKNRRLNKEYMKK